MGWAPRKEARKKVASCGLLPEGAASINIVSQIFFIEMVTGPGWSGDNTTYIAYMLPIYILYTY